MAHATGASPPNGSIRFEDVAKRSGLNFVLHNAATGGFRQIELMVGGVAVLDYTNDGCMDVFFTNGAAGDSLRKTGPAFFNRLFRNNCDMTFTDVTTEAGVAGGGYSIAAAAADYDNDGYTDLFVVGVDRNILYRNLGTGRFEDVTAKAGLSGEMPQTGKPWSVSAAWLDYDNDGKLDLFVSNYVVWDARNEPRCRGAAGPFYCHPDRYTGLPNQLFRNNGDGTFRDVSSESGVGRHVGKGMGVAVADFDGDGFSDIFVANDSAPNFLFHNLGGRTFREIGLEAGVALHEDGKSIAGMGADFRDFAITGRPGLVVSGMMNDGFQAFVSSGNGLFRDVGASSGLRAATRPFTGWGLGLFDFDNDGWKDLFVALSHFPDLQVYTGQPAPLPNRIFRNANGRFEDVSASAGPDFGIAAFHHGAAFADFDNDGLVDVVVSVVNGPARLFRNTTSTVNHWLAFRLHGKRANRDGLGATVQVELPDGRVLSNHASTSVGYGCSSEPLVRFGLGGQRLRQTGCGHLAGRPQAGVGAREGRTDRGRDGGKSGDETGE